MAEQRETADQRRRLDPRSELMAGGTAAEAEAVQSCTRRAKGETLVDIARSYNVHHSMISRLDRNRLD